MAEVSAYSALNVAATVDGQAVQGLWEGDNAIEVQKSVDIGSLMVGVQGDAIFSQTANRSARITIRVMHTSPTHRLLMQRMQAQRAGRVRAFSFDVLDVNNKDGGTGDKCFIGIAPTDSKGENATVREWVLLAADWKDHIPVAATV